MERSEIRESEYAALPVPHFASLMVGYKRFADVQSLLIYSVPGNAPPSSRMFWPVMKPALAPHRNAQA
jgi:hypothetical protein